MTLPTISNLRPKRRRLSRKLAPWLADLLRLAVLALLALGTLLLLWGAGR